MKRRIGYILLILAAAAGALYLVSPAAKRLTPQQIDAPAPPEPHSSKEISYTNVPVFTSAQETNAPNASGSLRERIAGLSHDSVKRQAELDAIAAEIPTAELERTLESIWDISANGPGRELSNMLLRRWAKEMPGLAASWISHKLDAPQKKELSIAVATVWANQKVSDAAEWVRQWPPEYKEQGILAVAYEASQASPRDALWLASELPPGDARDGLIGHAVSQWASEDATAPIAWAAEMEPSPLRDDVIAKLSLALSESDPKAAATLAIESLPSGKQQNDVIVGIVQRWAQKDMAKAAEWVEQFPEGPLREAALQNLESLASPPLILPKTPAVTNDVPRP